LITDLFLSVMLLPTLYVLIAGPNDVLPTLEAEEEGS
jgi:hypothetical protein